jgi:hypothetical protein
MSRSSFPGDLRLSACLHSIILGNFMVTMYLAYYTRDKLAKVASDPGNLRGIDHRDDGLIDVSQRKEASILVNRFHLDRSFALNFIDLSLTYVYF